MNKEYSNSIIYIIRSSTSNNIYIGSSKKKAEDRFIGHHMFKSIGFDNANVFYIEVYEKHPCKTVQELKKREGEVINEFKQKPEYNVLNKRTEWGRSKEDRIKKICECGKKYTPHSQIHITRHINSRQHQQYIKKNEQLV